MMIFSKRKPKQGVQYAAKTSRLQIYLRVFSLFVLFFCATYVCVNWQKILERLDNNRTISAFVLTNHTSFTRYDDIRDTIVKMGGLSGFFSQDIEVVRKQIETMTWIKSVAVRKIWPDKLSITIAEHQPIAIWNDSDFLSNDGLVFQLPMERLKNKDLPLLSGPDYQSNLVLENWYKIDANLKQKGLMLKKLAIDDRGSWLVTLDSGILLKLGRGNWQDKLERFATIYPQIEIPANKKLSYVDLRYDVGAAVGFTYQ